MSLKILKNKGVPFNNGILLFDYYLQLDEMHLFNFKVYQDKNTNIIKYISSCNNIIYKTDDNYLNIYNISFDGIINNTNNINNTTEPIVLTSSEEYQYKVVLLFINICIDYIKNSEVSSQQTMYSNLYHFINTCINNTNKDIDIIIPFIDSKTTVNTKYKYVPVLLSEFGRGTFTDWDFLKELHKLDGFDLFEKYRNSLQEFNTFFDINLDSFNINIERDLIKSYDENKFIYTAGLVESFNRVIEDDITQFINFYNNDTLIPLTSFENNIFSLDNNNLRLVFNLDYPDYPDHPDYSDYSSYIYNSFDFEYTIYDNVFNKLNEHFEIILEINSDGLNNIVLNIKNLKETYYNEQFYLNIDTFKIYYTKDDEIIKVTIIELDNINITINNKYNNQDDVNCIILQPEDLKIIPYSYDEKIKLNEENSTIYLAFEILDCDINLNTSNTGNDGNTIPTIPLVTIFDESIINIEDYYNGKEIQLNLLNNLDLNNGTIYDKNNINDNFYINTNLVLFLTFPYSSKKFSTYINFIGSSSSKFRIFVLNNTSLFFDTELIEYQKTNLYGFLLPCGKNYIDNKNYFVGYNKKTGYIEQFESYDNIKTLSNILCYVDEINTNDTNNANNTNDNTLKDLTVDFKLSENFNSSIWNDFYLLYKDKKINNITMN